VPARFQKYIAIMAGGRKKPRHTPQPAATTSNDEGQTFWWKAFAPVLPITAKTTANQAQANEPVSSSVLFYDSTSRKLQTKQS